MELVGDAETDFWSEETSSFSSPPRRSSASGTLFPTGTASGEFCEFVSATRAFRGDARTGEYFPMIVMPMKSKAALIMLEITTEDTIRLIISFILSKFLIYPKGKGSN